MEYVLVHHGILGQRWGVRRFQTKSGSLTSAGRKRYGVGDAKKKSADKDESSSSSTETKNKSASSSVETGKTNKTESSVHEDYVRAHSKKPVSSLSDKELQSINARLQAEQTYERLNPKKKSLGRKALETFILPAATDIAKSHIKKYMMEGAEKLEGKFKKDETEETRTSSNKNSRTKKETYTGDYEVKGKGTSKRSTGNSNRTTKSYSKIYTNDWSDISSTYTSYPGFNDTMSVLKGLTNKMSQYTPQVSLGRSYLAGLLSAPSSDNDRYR